MHIITALDFIFGLFVIGSILAMMQNIFIWLTKKSNNNKNIIKK